MKKDWNKAFWIIFGVIVIQFMSVFFFMFNSEESWIAAHYTPILILKFAFGTVQLYFGVLLAEKLGVKFKYLIGKTGDIVNDLLVPGVLIGGASALLFKFTNFLTPFAVDQKFSRIQFDIIKQPEGWSFLSKFIWSSIGWLFNFLLIVFIVSKIFHLFGKKKSIDKCFKTGIIVCSILSVIGYLTFLGMAQTPVVHSGWFIPGKPDISSLTLPSTYETITSMANIGSLIGLVFIRGLTFGYLFWKKGFESVIAAELVELAVRLFV